MKHKKNILKSMVITISFLLTSACANKMAVMETPATETPATEAVAGDTAPSPVAAPEESSPAQAVPEAKDPNQPEVIPLAAPATQASETGATAVATDISTQQTAEKAPEAAAVALETIPLPDIASIIKKFLNHRNTLWLSRTSGYRLYAGGLFTTEYTPDKGTISIKSDSGDPVLECKYTMDGKLDAQQASQQKACSTLTKAFDNYLSN